VQSPLHPQPNGSRPACSQFPFSNLSTGMKNGHATTTPWQRMKY
jgi:hypothetical protein